MGLAFPSLYQVNTRVWLTERSQELGCPATLDDVPDEALDRIAALGFDWVWAAPPPASAVNAALIGKLHRCCILPAVPNRVARRPGGLALR